MKTGKNRDPFAPLRAFAGNRPTELRFGVGLTTMQGGETRADPREYDWDGAHRGDARRPGAIFQYSIDGHGAFESAAGVARRVEAGSMFAAILPSRHRYFLPADAPQWTFCWLIFYHPYVVDRVRKRIASSGPILAAAPGSAFVTRMAAFQRRVRDNDFADVYDWEADLFALVTEWERACEQQVRPQSPREQLRDEVRGEVLRNIARPIDVASLANRHDMSRSAFAHHFKATTGLSPARFVVETRLQAVADRLRETDDKLAAIAPACGFADANHLCKVFRRYYATTPAAYRRQFRG